MMDIEFVHIAENTIPEEFEQNLLLSDLVWKAREK